MKKFAAIAVAASMFAMHACAEKTKRHLVQVTGWDGRWYTIAIHTNIVEAEADMAKRRASSTVTTEWRVEPAED